MFKKSGLYTHENFVDVQMLVVGEPRLTHEVYDLQVRYWNPFSQCFIGGRDEVKVKKSQLKKWKVVKK